jgi:hypothetical protein
LQTETYPGMFLPYAQYGGFITDLFNVRCHSNDLQRHTGAKFNLETRSDWILRAEVLRARSLLIMTTPGASRVSERAKSRPCNIEMPSVWK